MIRSDECPQNSYLEQIPEPSEEETAETLSPEIVRFTTDDASRTIRPPLPEHESIPAPDERDVLI
jgi:hypothetical protein